MIGGDALVALGMLLAVGVEPPAPRPIICRLEFSSDRSEPHGAGWRTDYPLATWHLLTRLSELTTTSVPWTNAPTHRPPPRTTWLSAPRSAVDRPVFWVVRGTDPQLGACPVLLASDVGTMSLSTEEADGLGAWLQKGGLLWADDFWGDVSLEQWRREVHKMLPDATLEPLPADHPILDVDLPQIANISFWLSGGLGRVAERGPAHPAQAYTVLDARGHVMILATHNTDIADTWEQEGANAQYFDTFAAVGYAIGINVILYALSH